MGGVAAWRTMRALRWASWFAAIAFAIYFTMTRSQHFNAFGQLTRTSETLLFAVFMAPGIIGMLEMWVRDAAGVPRRPPR